MGATLAALQRTSSGGFVARVSWRDPDDTIHIVDRPDAFTTWREADEASRFLAPDVEVR